MNLRGGVPLVIPGLGSRGGYTPMGSPREYQTFGMSMPIQTHFRLATCAEVDCDQYLHGWVTTVDMSTEKGQKQFHYITHDNTRRHTMQRVDDRWVKFIFGPGQKCYKNRPTGDGHRKALERPAVFTVRGGDWRGFTSRPYTHTKADFWVEHMQENSDRINHKRGLS